MSLLGKIGMPSVTASSPVSTAGNIASGDGAGFDADFKDVALGRPRTVMVSGRRRLALTAPVEGHDDEKMQSSAAAEPASQQTALAIKSAVSRAADDIRFVLDQLKDPRG